MANIKPILDKVVVKVQKQKTVGGLILAGSQKDQPVTATVVARGPGGMINGKEVKMYVNEGDTVLIPKNIGTEVNLNGQEYVIVAQEDILAMVV